MEMGGGKRNQLSQATSRLGTLRLGCAAPGPRLDAPNCCGAGPVTVDGDVGDEACTKCTKSLGFNRMWVCVRRPAVAKDPLRGCAIVCVLSCRLVKNR